MTQTGLTFNGNNHIKTGMNQSYSGIWYCVWFNTISNVFDKQNYYNDVNWQAKSLSFSGKTRVHVLNKIHGCNTKETPNLFWTGYSETILLKTNESSVL